VATNNFAVVLSDDADTGTKVYKGKLHNGPDVAVKRLNILSPSSRSSTSCRRSATTTSSACADDGERMIVTQYMPNGPPARPQAAIVLVVARDSVLEDARADAAGHGPRRQAPRHAPHHPPPPTSSCTLPGCRACPASACQCGALRASTPRPWRSLAPHKVSERRVRPRLEVLTGVSVWDEAKQSVVAMTLASFALPSIQAARLGERAGPLI
jgi:hypothetical protein